MPELPEVQTIVDDLNKKIIGRKIVGVWFDAPKLIKKPKPKDLRFKIKDLRITEIKRRGKNILIYLIDCQSSVTNYILLIHQKMTGHLLVGKWDIRKVSSIKYQVSSLLKGSLEEKVNDYIHLIFYLDDGRQLALSDLRKFAKVLFGEKEEIENLPELKTLGPEPLDKSFTFEKFKEQILYLCGRVRVAESASWRRRRAIRMQKIKQVLMDQNIIAGIGNIYSDEILWLAKIHPFMPAYKLKTHELKNIYSAMRYILKKAVKLRGTSISDYRDASGKPGNYGKTRLVYRREGESCRRCKTKIKRVKIGGRSAHYCPVCQPLVISD
ncbi:bifunctional DNA-formamidopyrimidine glycosylase/DNA-(apurinic or apyrimidinic site) lyase [Candidatus Wolfebacteria bacterium]|nr:bifunctional DNA-formamidopyrimidine glycosylase/DNA-(apurinic or apyrimidinic site) lyase [Candidatus Wolfebacteria bacterium]